MKGFCIASLLFIGAGTWAGEVPAEKTVRAVAAELAAGHFDAVAQRMSVKVEGLAGQLAQGWHAVTAAAGAYRGAKGATVQNVGSVTLVVLTLELERGDWELRVAVDKDGRLSALNLVPAPTAWKAPAYAPGPVDEQPATVRTSPQIALVGTLTLPHGAGPFPAVVLVHGSGPHDQDETLGPIRPFKDLAWGLAAHGVASLRYEKRTRAYPELFAPGKPYTVKEEVIDDARAAVTLLSHTARIDAHRIFIVGHSLGGTLAPRIAAGDPQVAGIVILAGATRPLSDLLVEQVKARGDARAIAAAEAAARAIRSPHLRPADTVEVLGSRTSGAYWLDLRRYHPADAAAALAIPILVLQGGRDIQVGDADYQGWARTLADHANARLIRYPNLTHLLSEGQGTIADYVHPAHVSAQVIDDVAAFVSSPKALRGSR